MFKLTSTRVILPIIASAIALFGCDKSEEKSEDPVLQYVPADTPYIFASLTPLPDDLMDKLEPRIERVLQSYQSVLHEVIATKQQELSEEERNSDEVQQMNAVVDELMTLLSVEGMREAGIGRESTGALYGNGLLPVARLQLTDGALFERTLTRLEEQAGQALPVAEIDGHSYRYFDADKIKIVIAVIEQQAVFTIVPASFDEAQTGHALGLTLPEKSIADTGVLQDIADKYGYTDHYVGFLDVAAFVEPFLGQATGVNAALLAAGEYDASMISDICRTEIRSVAGIAPRMVMGYTAINVDNVDSNIVVELREDLAAGLQGLAAAVPGLGGDKGGLMSFGMSLDVKAARAFVEARLDALEAEPFECEHFAELQAGVAGAREGLNQPVPPMVYDFKGFLAVIDNIEGLNIATQTPPTSVDGSFLLAMDNATALVSMGAMFSPEIAGLNLQSDGKPVALDLPQLQGMGMDAFAAMTDSALAISVGDESESQVVDILGAEASDPSIFMSFSMDAARYYSFLGDAMVAGGQDDEHAPSPELQAALNEVMQAVADVYDRMSAEVMLTDRGVEVQSSVSLKD
jgi:hypothetical protein